MEKRYWLDWRIKEFEPDSEFELKQNNNLLYKSLKCLDIFEKKILELLYGLNGSESYTVTEISRIFNFPVGRVHYIIDTALLKLFLFFYDNYTSREIKNFLNTEDRPPIIINNIVNLYY